MQVEDGVDVLAARDDQAGLVVNDRDPAQRAAGVVIATGAGLALDVRHPVWRPQPLQPVVVRLRGACLAVRHTWIRRSTASTISATASAMGTPFFCEPSR